MLDDPKSKAFVDNFSGQYLFVRNLAAQKPDPDEFPEFDNSLRRAFERETTLFFNAIVRENRPATELIDAKFTFLNERLAEFYGVPGVHGPQFRRVEITDPNRGGILGQGSLLTVTSYPNRTSVVQRGKWVLENLLGAPPPPPPPNVPSLDPHGKDGNLTMRQAMEAHRADPVCASCHSRMDPIGFSRELQWRGRVARQGQRRRDRPDRQAAGRSRFHGALGIEATAVDPAPRRVPFHFHGKADDVRARAGPRSVRPPGRAGHLARRRQAKRHRSRPDRCHRREPAVSNEEKSIAMIITKKALDRRMFLRGIGTAMALPLLDSMIPALAGSSTPPAVRLGFVYVPNGIIQKDWVPHIQSRLPADRQKR